jgi:NTP pyrophosphatase (non-canonical NTP hydrolase)
MHSTKEEEINLINRLYNRCLRKLRKNRSKDHWNSLTIEQAFDRLYEEIAELWEAIQNKESVTKVYDEAADVANFTAFIMDIYKHNNS